MKKYLIITLLVSLGLCLLVVIMALWQPQQQEINISDDREDPLQLTTYEKILRQDIISLMLAYPEVIVDIKSSDNSMVYLVTASGKEILYDDKNQKSYDEKLQNPDLQDMLEEKYLLEPIDSLRPLNYNPGRMRVYPLLKEVYGHNQSEIEKNLTGVRINSRQHRFSSRNEATAYLKKAISEINTLAEENPTLWKFIHPIGGTYNYRNIFQTNRLSPHAFGIAIDFASNKSDYWQWATRAEGEARLKSYPKDLVEIMERNYFVWGGKWGYFDILHFEYRPEIIIKALYFSDYPQEEAWYSPLPIGDTKISELIEFIDQRLAE